MRYTDPPGRNDPCPCGSGRKYKKCCWLTKDSPQARHALKLEAERLEYERAYAAFKAKCEAKGLDPEVELGRLVERRRRKTRRTLAAVLGIAGTLG